MVSIVVSIRFKPYIAMTILQITIDVYSVTTVTKIRKKYEF